MIEIFAVSLHLFFFSSHSPTCSFSTGYLLQMEAKGQWLKAECTGMPSGSLAYQEQGVTMTVPPGWDCSDVGTMSSNLKLLLPMFHTKLARPVAYAGVLSHHLEGGQDLMLLSWGNKHYKNQIHFKEQSS